MAVQLESLFPAEIERHVNLSPVLVLPFGTIEWHSHHLPLGLDGIVAQKMGESMAEAVNAILAPVCYWAVGGVPFPWTLRMPLAEVESLLNITISQYSGMGFQYIVVFTGHFGLEQTLAVKRAALHAMQTTEAIVLPFTTYDLVADFYAGDHAGIGETSLMMAAQPGLVRLAAWPPQEPLPGVIGEDPRPHATADLGRRIYEESSKRLANMLSGFRENKLDRKAWIASLATMAAILETTLTLRMTMPRAAVPQLTTADYLQGCALIAQGKLHEAQTAFLAKLAALQEMQRRNA